MIYIRLLVGSIVFGLFIMGVFHFWIAPLVEPSWSLAPFFWLLGITTAASVECFILFWKIGKKVAGNGPDIR